jgi:hypothetical protein
MKASLFYRITAVLRLLLLSDIHLVFASPIPHSFQRSESEAFSFASVPAAQQG